MKLQSRFELRSWFFVFSAAAIGVVFVLRLFAIQVGNKEYQETATMNVLRRVTLFPDRGYIYDRKGEILVVNQPAYDILVTPSKITSFDTLSLANDLGISLEQFRNRWRDMRKRRGYSSYRPNVFLTQIKRDEAAKFNAVKFKYEGFELQKRTIRDYPKPIAANVLGFIREVSDAYIRKHPKYRMGDYVGANGIEKSYEDVLRGEAGISFRLVDVHNREHGAYLDGALDTLPTPGSDVTSTLDISLQQLAEELLRGKRGSIVAIEPRSGEILVLATAPSYDPNTLVGRSRSANYNELAADSFNLPLFDRALLAEYPPGSPFKLVNGLIGLEEAVITENSVIHCRDGFHYGALHVACHAPAAPYALRSAVTQSCNGYFCTVFKSVIDKYPTAEEGMNAWARHVKSFGLGDFLHNDLSTGRPGLVPDGAYYNRMYGNGRWRGVTAISLGIGQGELLVTPIQLANMTAAIANRGFYYTPHIVKSIEGVDSIESQYTERRYTTIRSSYFNPVIEGMRDVFERPQGTAYASRLPGIPMAGKTGTAENPHGQDHSIFVSFAPVDNPQIAIAVIIENGYWGSRWAAPIASLLAEKHITDSISRPALYERMIQGDLSSEYEKQHQRP